VGAGLAGLTAAWSLVERGREVIVLEARDRVGGRVWTERIETPLGASVIERGAEFVLDGYEAFGQLLKACDLKLADTGMSYYIRHPAQTPHVTPEQIANAGMLASSLARARPGLATALDAIEAVDVCDDVRRVLRARVEISSATSAAEVSAAVFDHVGSFDPLPSWRVAGGNQQVADRLAGRVGE
jgi:monoamine oxidase